MCKLLAVSPTWMALRTVVVCFFLQNCSCADASTTGKPLTSFASRLRLQGLTLISLSLVLISRRSSALRAPPLLPRASISLCWSLLLSPALVASADAAATSPVLLLGADHLRIPAFFP